MGLQFKHITSTATFNTTKFSASSGDNTYFTGSDPNTQVAGTPDILYKDLVFCKCNGKIYTHGKFYDENGTDGFYSYLSRFSYYGIIISGCNVYRIQTSSSHPWYSRNRGMVFVRGTGIVSVDSSYATTQMDDPNIQDSIWKDNRLGTYHFSAADSAPTEDCVKILDWSDLARLSDLEVPIATEYQNGLVRVDSELNESSPNPIANSAVANKLLFINTSYFNQNADRAVDVYILLCTIKFLYNSGVATLYCNQEYNIGAPFYVKTDILYRYSSVSVGGIMSLTENLNIKVEIDANEYVKIFLKTSNKCTGRGVYTILGHLAEFIPNGEF